MIKKTNVVLLVIFCLAFSSAVEASRPSVKRTAPENVAILHNFVRYVPAFSYDPNKGKIYLIEAWDARAGRKLWEQKIYEIRYDLTKEQDVQDRAITALRVEDEKLIITNQNNNVYELDLKTRSVSKRKITPKPAGKERQRPLPQ